MGCTASSHNLTDVATRRTEIETDPMTIFFGRPEAAVTQVAPTKNRTEMWFMKSSEPGDAQEHFIRHVLGGSSSDLQVPTFEEQESSSVMKKAFKVVEEGKALPLSSRPLSNEMSFEKVSDDRVDPAVKQDYFSQVVTDWSSFDPEEKKVEERVVAVARKAMPKQKVISRHNQ